MITSAPTAPPVADLMNHAVQLFNDGRLAEAEAAGRKLLADDPGRPDTLDLLAVLALRQDRPADALPLLGRALCIDPAHPNSLLHLSHTLRRLGRPDAALAMIRRAALFGLEIVEACLALANILGDLGRHAEAAAALHRLLQEKPAMTEQRLQLARALILAGRFAEAVEAMLDLLAVQPVHVPAYVNLGVALRRLGRFEEAIEANRTALALAPEDGSVASNLGIIYQDLGRFAEAESCFRHAIMLAPDQPAAHLNLSLTYRDAMQLAPSIRQARRAALLDPASAEAHTALGYALLINGELAEGFAEYEWRSRMADFPSPKRSFPSPLWQGEDLAGRTLVVHDEQGVGDAIMFARYARLLQARGARVFLECNAQLVRLMAGLTGIKRVISRFDTLPTHDFHVSLASLPHRLGENFYTIPAAVPYLRVEPKLVHGWAKRLGPRRGLRIGLVWAGNPEFKGDRVRSPRLEPFLPLLEMPGIEVFGLQKGAGREDLADRAMPPCFVDLGEAIGDFADTAAIMMNLDLVVSSCTGPAHLAGALGQPVWTVLPFAPDWRWFEHGLCTPWYPTMRLFRQDRRGDWGPVMARLREALAALASRHA